MCLQWRSEKREMKVAIFNVKYSANLGDGIIACCLEAALERGRDWSVTSIDLAGRWAWNSPAFGRKRALALFVLQKMPRFLRDLVFETLLGRVVRKDLVPRWEEACRRADAVVFGGGQLIQDVDLNFPLKIGAAADVCARKGLPVAVYAVGAAPLHSKKGISLFDRLLRSKKLVYAAARDEASRDVLASRGCTAQVCRDPGLLASVTWPVLKPESVGRPHIGLGITHPLVLAHHGGAACQMPVEGALKRFFDVTKALVERGYCVTCFTNGAGEDEFLKEKLRSSVTDAESEMFIAGGAGQSVKFARRCETPEDLARLVASFDLVVAHRLHAIIAAYSYAIPSVGLRWDAKLDGFFASIGRGADVIDFDDTCAGVLPALVTARLEDGVDIDTHERVLAECTLGIEELAQALLAAHGAGRRVAA